MNLLYNEAEKIVILVLLFGAIGQLKMFIILLPLKHRVLVLERGEKVQDEIKEGD